MRKSMAEKKEEIFHELEGTLRDESEEHRVRVEKIQKLRDKGIDPWPSMMPVDAKSELVLSECNNDEVERRYSIAGRLMSVRLHGKTAFAHIQDAAGRLQIYLRKDKVGEEAFGVFEHLIDVGDIIWVEGTSFKTKMGETTLNVEKYVLLSKCLYPLPEKFHGLQDIETKYRQRYLDLLMDKDSRDRFMKRSNLIHALRSHLEAHDYIEVETPMLHPIAGGAAAKPFVTHHNALHSDFYLRIAPELYLKRLIIGGFERVFEINRNFRNEGISTRHNPEFTMLEFYTAHQDYQYSLNFVEDLMRSVVDKICKKLEIPFGEHTIDFGKPFKRCSMAEALVEHTKLTQADLQPETIDTALRTYGVKIRKGASAAEKVYALFEELVESKLIQPTFIVGFPIEVSPLTKKDPHNPSVAPRFEFFIAGMEIANSYNELNDPFDQAQRFMDQLKHLEAGDEEAHQFDADFIRALEYGLPPTSGVGIGIDRLAMILTNTTSIKEVILFPTLKKK
jgi:lysyl-tRNA synthetase class 2